MKRLSLKGKIILVTTLCVLLVGIVSNIFLYSYLSNIILEKSDHISAMNLENVKKQLGNHIKSFENLGNLCANDSIVARAMRQDAMVSTYEKKIMIEAQSVLDQYLGGANLSNYVDKLMAFNEHNLAVQVFSRAPNLEKDPYLMQQKPFFKDYGFDGKHHVFVTTALSSNKETIAYLAPIYESTTEKYRGWIYMELNNRWIEQVLSGYSEGDFFLYYNEEQLYPVDNKYPYDSQTVKKMLQEPKGYDYYEAKLQTSLAPLPIEGMQLGSVMDISFLEKDGRPIAFTLFVVVLTSILVAVLLAILLSGYITGPINRLIQRIQRISENDFSHDESIEKGSDEIAKVGKMVNEMSASIEYLLSETEDMYAKQKDSEIALLQSQINPHFLYNTLDSIHWMAAIQKNTGIVQMTRSLSSLLKNIAKGVGDIITLQEEIALLEDYITIQSIRYMENFDVTIDIQLEHLTYGIIKLTLQPLVENAIYHGIEPTGTYGTIVVSSEQEGEDLIIAVTDDGVGMTPQEIQAILAGKTQRRNSGFSGMGVKNVHDRIQLMYGAEYGLRYESEPGQYTKVMVCIPAIAVEKEESHV